MKKTIFNNLFNEVILFFFICSLTLTLIVWIIQAVNFIDIISEDGHSIITYFSYAILNIPKIYSKLLLLSFFLSIYYILVVYEDKNQLIIFWINGISKVEFLNKLIFLSLIFAIFSLILSYLVVPFTQDKARSFIRDSNLDFFPSLIKPKKFIDTVENLTIFLDEKKNDSMKKILIKDSSIAGGSQLIISKSGKIAGNEKNKYLSLNDGIIINYGESKKLTSFNFEQSNFNLSQFKTKTTITPKIQETKSGAIIKCLRNLKSDVNKKTLIDKLNCEKSFIKNLTQEIYKRTVLPLYIPILCIIASLVVLKSSNNDRFKNFKLKIFLSGIFIIIFSQISINTVSISIPTAIITLCVPFILLSISYLFFLILGLIMGLLEEINFFSDFDVKYFYPIYLVILNVPSLIYEIFPFIFLLSSQFLFLKLIDNGELNTFKNHGLDNLKILKLITSVSLVIGIFIVIIFYNLSAIMKFEYLSIKKNFTKDNKYLATITENGLWIKDEINEQINFINARKFTINSLGDVDIIQLNKDFEFQNNIKAENVDIQKNNWNLYGVKIIDKKNSIKTKDTLSFLSNFNYEEISNLFSNLASLTIWNLLELKKNYISINYSTTEVDYHLQRIIAYPFLITIITALSAILMLNLSVQKPKLFFIVIGILLSVIIYYINFFFGTLGKNEKIPLLVSIWTPIVTLSIISLIGIVRINEK